MKKYVRIFLSLIFLFIVFHFFSLFLYRGKTTNYTLKTEDKKYQIHEEYIRNKNNTSNHYYIEIKFDEFLFNFRVDDIFDRKSYVVDTIYLFQNQQYTCILPIFLNSSIQTDILCENDGIIYPYLQLKNKSLELDKFAISMEEHGYLKDKNEIGSSSYGMDIIKGNLISSHTLIIPSYRGIYLINSKEKNAISSIDLFKEDVYAQTIQALAANYYVVADYDSSYTFHTFKLVDLSTKKVSSIYSDDAISMNSYVQGVIDNCIYIIDRSNQKQYKIDVLNKKVTLIGNSKKGILYYNGIDFETKSIYDALNSDMLFDVYSIESSIYDYVYEYDDVYYSYLKNSDGYDVYISYEENPSLYTYGFFLSSIDKVKYGSGFLYYIDGNMIYCYRFKSGAVPIVLYDEFLYNVKLDFFVYGK